MLFSDIHPFIRFARNIEIARKPPGKAFIVACDHRLLYTVSGTGHAKVGNEVYQMEPGSLLIYPSGTPYQLIAASDRQTMLCFNFDYLDKNSGKTDFLPVMNLKHYHPEYSLEQVVFEDAVQFNKPFYLKQIKGKYSVLKEISNEWNLRRQFYRNETSALFITFLNHIARNYPQSGADRIPKIHTEILLFVADNFNQPMTNKHLGEIFNYHPYYISKIILKQTGLPLHQYLLKLRIEKAKELIVNSDKSISEIAEQVGFKNMSYFSQYFKKSAGCSPKEFRAARK